MIGRIRHTATIALAGLLCAAGCSDDTPPSTTIGKAPPQIFSGDIFFTDAWSGEWNIELTFRDCATNDIVVVEDIVGTICPGDTLRLSFSGVLSECDGQITDTRLDAACDYVFTSGTCNVRVTFAMNLERDGDAITGSGVWTAATSQACANTYGLGCEVLEISGVRLGPAPEPCVLPNGLAGLLTLRPREWARTMVGTIGEAQ